MSTASHRLWRAAAAAAVGPGCLSLSSALPDQSARLCQFSPLTIKDKKLLLAAQTGGWMLAAVHIFQNRPGDTRASGPQKCLSRALRVCAAFSPKALACGRVGSCHDTSSSLFHCPTRLHACVCFSKKHNRNTQHPELKTWEGRICLSALPA